MMAIHFNHPCNCNTLITSNPLSSLTSPNHNNNKAPRPGTTTTTTLLRARAAAAPELIRSGEVRPIRPSEAWAVVGREEGGFAVLDVRPAWERERARVAGSVHVPLFIGDDDNGPLTLLKKWVHFGYIGLWTGQHFTTLNPLFLEEVEKAVPDKTTKLLVACGEGLRSMKAVSKLYEAGYKNLGWLAGGFNRSSDGDFPAVEGPEKLEYATIGGVSYIFLQLLILLRAVGNKNSSSS